MPNMLAAALDFAEKGIPVFPASAKTKKPLTPNGSKTQPPTKHRYAPGGRNGQKP